MLEFLENVGLLTASEAYAWVNARQIWAVGLGPIGTGMTPSLLECGPLGRQVAALPPGRVAQPEEIANVVLFLSYDQSNYITGKTIGVDGVTYTV